MVLLGLRENTSALELAQKLNKHIPDNVVVRGLIADACMELGDYEQAENQSQWMFNLGRGNLPGMIRGALLRRDPALERLKTVPPYPPVLSMSRPVFEQHRSGDPFG